MTRSPCPATTSVLTSRLLCVGLLILNRLGKREPAIYGSTFHSIPVMDALKMFPGPDGCPTAVAARVRWLDGQATKSACGCGT